MQLEQWARLDLALSKIKTYSEISTKKMRVTQSRIDVFWIWRTYDLLNGHATGLTDMRYVWRARNESRTYNRLKVEQNITYISIHTFIERWLTALRIYLIKYLDNDLIRPLVSSISAVEAEQKKIARRRRYINVRLLDDDLASTSINATYSRLHVEQMTSASDAKSEIYRSTKTSIISFNCSAKTRRLYKFYETFGHHRPTKTHICIDYTIARATSLATTNLYMIATCERAIDCWSIRYSVFGRRSHTSRIMKRLSKRSNF